MKMTKEDREYLESAWEDYNKETPYPEEGGELLAQICELDKDFHEKLMKQIKEHFEL